MFPFNETGSHSSRSASNQIMEVSFTLSTLGLSCCVSHKIYKLLDSYLTHWVAFISSKVLLEKRFPSSQRGFNYRITLLDPTKSCQAALCLERLFHKQKKVTTSMCLSTALTVSLNNILLLLTQSFLVFSWCTGGLDMDVQWGVGVISQWG